MHTLSTFLNIVLEVTSRATKQEKVMRGIQTRKKEVKMSLFADNIIINIENSKKATQQIIRTNK